MSSVSHNQFESAAAESTDCQNINVVNDAQHADALPKPSYKRCDQVDLETGYTNEALSNHTDDELVIVVDSLSSEMLVLNIDKELMEKVLEEREKANRRNKTRMIAITISVFVACKIIGLLIYYFVISR
jgi:hypothetical protein